MRDYSDDSEYGRRRGESSDLVGASPGGRHSGRSHRTNDGIGRHPSPLSAMTRREFLLLSAVAGMGLLAGCHGCGFRRKRKPSLVLVVSDTLRADHVGSYGCTLPLTPNLDGLARRGVVFENMMAAAPVTGAVHASIMTGAYPNRTGVARQGGTIASDLTTLAEVCRDSGYRTAAFVSNPALSPDLLAGIARGFDIYDAELPSMERNRQSAYREGGDTVDKVLQWLRQESKRPFFLWVHLQEPHGPYETAASHLSRVESAFQRTPGGAAPLPVLEKNRGQDGIPQYEVLGDLRDPDDYRLRYAARAAYADEQAGRVLDEAWKLTDDGLVAAALSDHGELLGEHGYYFQHDITLLRPVLHVPFIVAGPGIEAGSRVPRLAGSVDIMPTLLDLLGIDAAKAAPSMQGESLKEASSGAGDGEPVPRFSICIAEEEWGIRLGDWKYTAKRTSPGRPGKLVNLSLDPKEEQDFSKTEPARAAELRELLLLFMDRNPGFSEHSAGSLQPLTQDQQRRLRSLGYLE